MKNRCDWHNKVKEGIMMLIGSHLHMTEPDYLLGAARQAVEDGESTFMVYTGSPKNTERIATSKMKIEEAWRVMNEHDIAPLIVHVPYIVNLANRMIEERYQFDIQVVKDELKRAEKMGAITLCLSVGSAVETPRDEAIQNVIDALNVILEEPSPVTLSLVNSAGMGHELGSTFEELKTIVDGVPHPITVSLNTSHLYNAGYDIRHHQNEVFHDFDRMIGLSNLSVLIVCDSRYPFNSHHNIHDNIGYGTIGFDAMYQLVHDDQFQSVPKILDTPYLHRHTKEVRAPFAYEIQILETGHYDPKWRDKL